MNANQESVDWLHAAQRNRAAWSALESAAVERYGFAPLTSGIGNAANAPWHVKDALRNLARNAQACTDRSLEAWIASGRRAHTWRRMRDRVERDA